VTLLLLHDVLLVGWTQQGIAFSGVLVLLGTQHTMSFSDTNWFSYIFIFVNFTWFITYTWSL